MKPVGILRFLGTNCDADVLAACDTLKISNKYIWWADHFNYQDYSAFILPGGFSYGDYLRAGAMAARTPAMDDLRAGALAGYPVLGICNGFQILCESELLPGILTKNLSQNFQEQWVDVRVLGASKNYRLPIAHSMGRFYAPDEKIEQLFDQEQVWLQYSENPNGSVKDIAGITSEGGNVRALMPHPERAMHDWMGSDHGRQILQEIIGGK